MEFMHGIVLYNHIVTRQARMREEQARAKDLPEHFEAARRQRNGVFARFGRMLASLLA